jgi:signal transduction histidine kinase
MAGAANAAPRNHAGIRLVGRFGSRRLPLALWIALWTAAVAAEILALLPLIRSPESAGHPVYTILRLVGGSFAVCGLIAWHRRPDNRSGLLMTATGFAFFVTPLLSQVAAPVAQTLGYLLPDLWLLFFVLLMLTFLTGGRLRTKVDLAIVGVVAVTLLVLPAVRLLFHDIDGNLLFIQSNPPFVSAVEAIQRVLFAAAALAAVVVVTIRFVAASGPGRRALLPSIAGAACLVLFVSLILRDLVLGFRLGVVGPLDWAVAISIITVPAVFLAGLLRSRLARGGLTELFRRLRDIPADELQPALARAIGDPAMVIAFRQPDATYVDAGGAPVVLPGPDDPRSVTPVERDGTQVAALVYDRSLDDDPELVEAVGAAAMIALENRHLQEEGQARLTELRASRERIVAAGDAERRRIERNLHDGAQQRLVLLAMRLSEIQSRIRADPSGAELLVTSASDELAQSLTELRELASGIHPSSLDHGLDVALEALCLRSAVPTTVSVEPGPRLPEPVAFAAYFVTSEALTNIAKYARATSASVDVTRRNGSLAVTITDDGVGGADPAGGTGLRGLNDRVEALGGTLRVGDRPTGGAVVAAELPLDR